MKKIGLPFDEQQRILYKNATILTMDKDLGDFEKGDILISGKNIEAIGTSLSDKDAVIIDVTGMIIIPGLIDAHRHAWQGTLRRLMPNVENLNDYIDATHFSLAKHYRPQDMYVGNLLTALSCIDGGITTLVDASHNARSMQHADASINALEDAGIRALYAPGRPLAGEWTELDLERLQKDRFSKDDQLVTLAMLSQPDKNNWTLARKLGLKIITEFLGPEMSSYLPGLKEQGLLGPDNIFNHVTGLPEEAWQILQETGVKVTIDPRSDAQYGLAEGVFAYQHAIDHGMRPAIGTDLETAYSGDMFTEMQVAFSIQRAFAQNRRFNGDENAPQPIKVREVLQMATINGAHVTGLETKTGSLTPGKQADMVMLCADDLNLFPVNNAMGTVVLAADRSNVHTVMVAGRVLKSGGEIVGFDQNEMKTLIEESLNHLFKATDYQPDILATEFAPIAGPKPANWTGV